MRIDYDVLIAQAQMWSEKTMEKFYDGESRADESPLVETSGDNNELERLLARGRLGGVGSTGRGEAAPTTQATA